MSILFICIICFCISPKEKFIFGEKIREEFLREERRNGCK